MVRDLAVAGHVLEARDLIGEDEGEQIVGLHALELGRHLLAAAETQHAQGTPRVPAETRREQGRVEQGLHEHVARGRRAQEVEHVIEGEAVGRAEGDHDRVLGRRRLQLHVEAPAEALAQGEAEGAVDAATEGRVQDQVHPARLVEEALEDERLARGHRAEGRHHARHVLGELPCGPFRQADDHLRDAGRRPVHAPVLDEGGHLFAHPRHRPGQLVGARRCLADPERDGGRCAARVLDPHLAPLHAQNAIGRVAELEDVARHALDGEVLVERADARADGLEHHLVVGVVRDGAARGDGGDARAAPPADAPVHRVVMDHAPRLPRWVVKPSASMRTTASKSSRPRFR